LSFQTETNIPNYLDRMSDQFKVAGGEEQLREAERRILDQLIDEKLVNQEADRLAITFSEREVDMGVKDMQNRNGLNDASLRQPWRKKD